VPAECILYFNPLFFIRRWTSAISAETEAVGVPIGMRQKSAVHFGGVARSASSDDMMIKPIQHQAVGFCYLLTLSSAVGKSVVVIEQSEI
jgi:hypothetical protein